MMRNLFLLGMLTLVALGGCGRKELPQPDTSAPLRIVDLKAEKAVSVLQLRFTIQGGFGPVGYQIDRAEVDPVCSCLTAWQRYFEQPALTHQKDTQLVRNLKLLDPHREFAFRIRAVDSVGNLSTWSKPMRARADPIP
jgi:predicted small lipoprotein YifL